MQRQTEFTVEQLIEFCECKLEAGGHAVCGHGHGPLPLCRIINELGVSALQVDDKKAQTFLVGLLARVDEMCQFIALCYLIQIDTFMTEDRIKLDEFTAANTKLAAEALKKIEDVNKPNLLVN